MTPLIILRHGPTAWNAEKRIQGRSDIPLSENGRKVVGGWRLKRHEFWGWNRPAPNLS